MALARDVGGLEHYQWVITSGRIRRPGQLPSYVHLPTRSWFLAPPRRTSTMLDGEILTLHTVQTREAYETLVHDGVLVGDSSKGWDEFQEAYGWMLRRMNERRLPGESGGLLWLWAAITNRQLRGNAKRARGQVLLTVEVARERVLLTDFSDWHAALNRSLHVAVRPGESDDEWDARWTGLADDFHSRAQAYDRMPLTQWPDELRAELESSWDAIADPATWCTDASLQATMHELLTADVVRAVRIR